VNNKEVYSKTTYSEREETQQWWIVAENIQNKKKSHKLKGRWKKRLEVRRPALPVVNRRRLAFSKRRRLTD
jgi:hypothetical protein